MKNERWFTDLRFSLYYLNEKDKLGICYIKAFYFFTPKGLNMAKEDKK